MESLLAHCSSIFASHGGSIAAFFVGGLAGSLTHCLAMCGPAVACQSACASPCQKRAAGLSQWPYHLGRTLTYGGLGMVASALSAQLVAYAFWPHLASLLLVIAGLLFLLSGIFAGRHPRFAFSSGSVFLRGALMGFMPCGLLYAALMVAATLPNPLHGFLAMCSFALGTTPALVVASSSANLLAQRWRHIITPIGRAGLTFNGLALLLMAEKLAR